MHRWRFTSLFLLVALTLSVTRAEEPTLLIGFSSDAARAEREWEGKFRSTPSPDNLRDYMKRLSARPHHVGSPYDKENAEWILCRFKEWGRARRNSQFAHPSPTL